MELERGDRQGDGRERKSNEVTAPNPNGWEGDLALERLASLDAAWTPKPKAQSPGSIVMMAWLLPLRLRPLHITCQGSETGSWRQTFGFFRCDPTAWSGPCYLCSRSRSLASAQPSTIPYRLNRDQHDATGLEATWWSITSSRRYEGGLALGLTQLASESGYLRVPTSKLPRYLNRLSLDWAATAASSVTS